MLYVFLSIKAQEQEKNNAKYCNPKQYQEPI